MKQKIDVNNLRPGMYVSELDRPWIETPFLFQGFEVRTTLDIEEIKRYCVYVYIDTQPRQDVKLRSFFPERLLSRSERHRSTTRVRPAPADRTLGGTNDIRMCFARKEIQQLPRSSVRLARSSP